jgi:hypothetical protein
MLFFHFLDSMLASGWIEFDEWFLKVVRREHRQLKGFYRFPPAQVSMDIFDR